MAALPWPPSLWSPGPFLGILPTGRHIVQMQVHILRFVCGMGAERWAVGDDLGLLRQIGALAGGHLLTCT